jgi:hypothetical protein
MTAFPFAERLAPGWRRALSAAINFFSGRDLSPEALPVAQILKKIFRRYIQNRMNQKISITAKP